MAEAVLIEVAVKGKDRFKPSRLDEGEGCAVREAEVFVMVPHEDTFCLRLDHGGHPESRDPRGSEGMEELDCEGVTCPRTHERGGLIYNVIRSVKLGPGGFK